MFIELNPGTKGAPLAKENFDAPDRATRCPTSTPTSSSRSLDADTRDYLKLLLKGARRRAWRAGGRPARGAASRFEPTYRDLAAVSSEVADAPRRAAPAHQLAAAPEHRARLASDDDLAQLVDSSATRLPRVRQRARRTSRATVRELPSALEEAERRRSARSSGWRAILRPAADEIRPAVRALDRANKADDARSSARRRRSLRERHPPVRARGPPAGARPRARRRATSPRPSRG